MDEFEWQATLGPITVSVVSTDEDLARVTIISASRRVDLALPGNVTLSELLPSILKFSGQEANTPAEAVHSWGLQRFGSDPFDLYTPIGNLGIRDGETLHLRQRENAMPDAAFDDVVDAVAGATNSRPRWVPRNSRTMGLIVMCVLLIGLPLLGVLSMVGSESRLEFGAAVAVAAFLSFAAFIASVSLARAAGERVTATCLGWCSVVLAGITGWFLPGIIAVGEIPMSIRVVVASALMLASAAAVALAARVHAMPMLAIATASGLMLAAASVAAVLGDRDVEVAAITMALMAMFTASMPTWSYRIAGIALPSLPVTTEAMLADESDVQSDIVRRALLADRLLGAFLTATSAVALTCSLMVLQQGTIWSAMLTICIGLAFMLRARAFVGLSQRIALLLGGAAITTIAMLALASPLLGTVTGLLVLFAVALLLGYIFAHYSASTFSKILSPTWGRWGDVFEWFAIMGIVPTLLGLLDLYSRFRAMFG